jgi:hypothetical protein
MQAKWLYLASCGAGDHVQTRKTRSIDVDQQEEAGAEGFCQLMRRDQWTEEPLKNGLKEVDSGDFVSELLFRRWLERAKVSYNHLERSVK